MREVESGVCFATQRNPLHFVVNRERSRQTNSSETVIRVQLLKFTAVSQLIIVDRGGNGHAKSMLILFYAGVNFVACSLEPTFQAEVLHGQGGILEMELVRVSVL